jgi:tRNA (cmo5U34)-methyltransferase
MKVDKNISAENATWSFHGIANNFEDHVRNSVPFYDVGHSLVCQYSDFFLKDQSTLYDIGSSTGLLLRKLLDHHKNKNEIKFIGIDPVDDMIDFAKKHIEDHRVDFICNDIMNENLSYSNLIVSYYTIQFINPNVRQQVFNKIYNSLEWGGGFILFEKIRAPDARFQDYASQIYSDYKLNNGFSESEIIHKTRSLKGVMEPYSEQANIDMMKRAGFSDITSVFKWVCFEGFLAIK